MGFSAAFMNGYVNRNYVANELGKSWVGAFSSITTAAAAILVHAFRCLATKSGKLPVLIIGSLSAAFIPAYVFVVGLQKEDGVGFWLALLYLPQGGVRAVYESTNRGIFSDFFPGEAA